MMSQPSPSRSVRKGLLCKGEATNKNHLRSCQMRAVQSARVLCIRKITPKTTLKMDDIWTPTAAERITLEFNNDGGGGKWWGGVQAWLGSGGRPSKCISGECTVGIGPMSSSCPSARTTLLWLWTAVVLIAKTYIYRSKNTEVYSNTRFVHYNDTIIQDQ